MDIMDPYTAELLSAAALPGAFSGRAAAYTTEFDYDYLRSIGALPRHPCAGIDPAYVGYPFTLEPSTVMLPASWDLFAAALGAYVMPLTHSVPRKRAAPVSDVAAPVKRPRISWPFVPDYDADIDFNLREKERNAVRQLPSSDYLRTVQGDRMDERTRSDLVVWMDDLTKHYRLFPGILHRAVSYDDRVLSARTLSSNDSDHELRLLGATAVFTAVKYEARSTILQVNAADVAGYCGFATGKEVPDMEREMLATLRYELSGSTTFTFVQHFTRHSRGEKTTMNLLAHKIADTSLFDYRFLQYMPSAVAATALFLAMLVLDLMQDNHELIELLTGYKAMDLMDQWRRTV